MIGHFGFGPPPQTKPDLQTVMGLYDMMSPEKETQLALAQHALQSAQQGDQFAHQFGGAPNMDAARLFQSGQYHEDMQPMHEAQMQLVQEKTSQKQEGDKYAQQQGYPNIDALRISQQGQEHDAGLAALQQARQNEQQQRELGAKEKGVSALMSNPMLAMPDDAQHPQPAFMRAQKSALLDTYPELGKYLQAPSSDPLASLTPQQRAAIHAHLNPQKLTQ